MSSLLLMEVVERFERQCISSNPSTSGNSCIDADNERIVIMEDEGSERISSDEDDDTSANTSAPATGSAGTGGEDDDSSNGDDGDVVYVPPHLICPLTLEIMNDPVMSKYGHNFERKAIIDWLRGGHGGADTCPLTRRTLHLSDLVSNHALRIQIDNWFDYTINNYHQQQGHENALSATQLGGSASSSCETPQSLQLLHNQRQKQRAQKAENHTFTSSPPQREIYAFLSLPTTASTNRNQHRHLQSRQDNNNHLQQSQTQTPHPNNVDQHTNNASVRRRRRRLLSPHNHNNEAYPVDSGLNRLRLQNNNTTTTDNSTNRRFRKIIIRRGRQ